MYDADYDVARNALRRVEVIEVKDDGKLQHVTFHGMAGEKFKLSIRGQGHGMTSVPTVGSVGYALLVTGRPDQSWVYGLEDPKLRPNNRKEGETVVYAKKGQTVELDDNGDVLIKSPSGTVHINP